MGSVAPARRKVKIVKRGVVRVAEGTLPYGSLTEDIVTRTTKALRDRGHVVALEIRRPG